MWRRRLGYAAAAFLATASGGAFAQGDGGFGNQYVQAPSFYYPYPGIIESRFGTYFSTPVIPGVPESPVEAATVNATNAARAGVDLNAVAREEALAKDAAEAARRERPVARKDRSNRTYARGYNRPPAPFRRALPSSNLDVLNNSITPSGYTPAAREQTYGRAYGMGPYGSNFYSGFWHGYAPMNYYPVPVYPVIP